MIRLSLHSSSSFRPVAFWDDKSLRGDVRADLDSFAGSYVAMGLKWNWCLTRIILIASRGNENFETTRNRAELRHTLRNAVFTREVQRLVETSGVGRGAEANGVILGASSEK